MRNSKMSALILASLAGTLSMGSPALPPELLGAWGQTSSSSCRLRSQDSAEGSNARRAKRKNQRKARKKSRKN